MLGPTYSVAIYDKMEAIETDWRSLEQHAVMTPYQKWDVINAWLDSVGVPKHAQLTIASIHEGGKLVCILPLMIRPCCTLRVLCWLADAHFNYQGGLYDRDFISALGQNEFSQIWKSVTSHLPRYDYVELEQQAMEWDGVKSPFTHLSKVASPNMTHQLIFPHHDYDQLLKDTRSKKTRKRYRNVDSRLQKLGEVNFLVIKKIEQAREYLEELFLQRKIRFEELGITPEKNQNDYEAFYKKLIDTKFTSPDDSAYITVMKLGEETLAIGFILETRGEAHALLSSMTNTPLRKHSPGETLLRNEIKYHCLNNTKLIDFGVGSDPYKTAWCNNEVALFDSYQAKSLAGYIAIPLLRAANSLKRRIKNSHHAWALYRKVRASKLVQSLF